MDHTRFKKGLTDGLPICLGYLSVSFAFGVYAVSSGLTAAEALLLSLDMVGIAGSSGSACTSGSLDPSHVLLAIGLPHEIAHGSLRLSLGRNNTMEEVEQVLKDLPVIVERLRAMSPLYADRALSDLN